MSLASQVEEMRDERKAKVKELEFEVFALKEVGKNSARKIAALEDENEQLRCTVAFHEKFDASERKEKAYGLLIAMIQSQHPSKMAGRQDVDVKKWVRKAYEFADALESEGGKQ
jgi:tRNA U54 and U55 pseudouridine synthase Pus10